jgi:RND superfamily putative drug exporter
MKNAVRSMLRVPGGRRTKFAVIGVWLLVAVAIGPLSGKFEDAQKNEPIDYLPGSAESVKALEALEDFPSADQADAITVFRREGGLSAADRAVIDRTRAAIDAKRREGVGRTSGPVVSRDGTTALLSTPIDAAGGYQGL